MMPSRGIASSSQRLAQPFICASCLSRAVSTTSPLSSGHNRWSKIKHDKAKVDAGKNKQRSIFSKEIAHASKLWGPDPATNNRLADIINKAKREGFAKSSIASAIARGQGRSTSGAALESVTVEGLLPNNVAVIIDCETDSKMRTLQEVRLVLRNKGGTVSPISYLFQKQGRITFEAKDGVGVDDVLEPALEVGAMDVLEGEDGRVVVCAEPTSTKAVGEAIAHALGLEIAALDIGWIPKDETTVELAEEKAIEELTSFVDEVYDRESTVQAVSMNVAQGSLGEGPWRELMSRLNS